MATHHGNAGTVKFGSNTVAEIDSFEFTENAETADDSSMGDTARTHLSGKKSWTARVRCHWDETDTNGQGTMTVGTLATLAMYPEGAATGAKYYSGSATVNGFTVSTPQDGIVSAEFSCIGHGALTLGTAA